jgi:hypothetical protein
LDLAPRRSFAVLGCLLLALAIWALWLGFFGDKPSSAWAKWGLLVFLVYLFGHYFVYVPLYLKRRYRQHKALQREQSLFPTESGLTVTTENGEGALPWSDFLAWKESDKLFMLYVADGLYHIVPKRFFAQAADIDNFRAMLRRLVRRR